MRKKKEKKKREGERRREKQAMREKLGHTFGLRFLSLLKNHFQFFLKPIVLIY